ncbi:conserved protein of unknown function [Burkholderia multivorans]
MNTAETTQSVGVRTVLHLSPAVCAAALRAAQQAGQTLQEWLDDRVAYAMADDTVMVDQGLDFVAPWSLACAELFAQVANNAPEVLRGRWALLYERVRLERNLWHEPAPTLEAIEAGAPFTEPYLSVPKLRAVWPRLCAATFCV